jgi:putative copper resistance protein D
MLRAFADGHRARVLLTTPIARRPWLAAPNFHYQGSDGSSDELKRWREHSAVLVIFADAARAATRVQALSGDSATLHKRGLRILLVAPAQFCAVLVPADTAFTCIVKGGDDAAIAYRLLSRTLSASGPRSELLPESSDAEFLIDRYGYLRARWLPSDTVPPWSSVQLRDMQQALGAEPRIRAAPDLHVH